MVTEARMGLVRGRPAVPRQEINVENWIRSKNWHDPVEGDPHAPNALIYTDVGEDWYLSNHLMKATFDDTIDITSEMVLQIASPGGIFIEYPPIRKGREIELWIGYGEERYFIGRGEIIATELDFGSDLPTLTIKAHDKSWIMKRKNLTFAGAERTPRRQLEAEGTKFKGTVAGFVRETAKKYGFETSIHKRFESLKDTFHRPKIQDDWAVIQALANFHGAVSRVNWDMEKKAWVLIFEDVSLENSSGRGVPQENHYTFSYAQDDFSTLMQPVFKEAIDDQVNEIQAWFWDPRKKNKAGTLGEWILLTDDGSGGKSAPSPRSLRDKAVKNASAWENARKNEGVWWRDPVIQPVEPRDPRIGVRLDYDKPFPKDPTLIKIAAGGFSVEIADVKFKNAADAAQFIRQWFEKNRSAFTIATGKVPGIKILSGEHHVLAGEDLRSYAGVYFFAKVTHEYSSDGYFVDFVARQMLR